MGKSKKPSGPLEGIQFPLTGGGKRSTTSTGKAILAASLQTLSDASAFDKLTNEKDKKWRFGYQKHIYSTVQLMAEADSKTLLKMSLGGLQKAHDVMEFYRGGEKVCSMAEAMVKGKFEGTFETGVVKGQGKIITTAVAPYRGKEYSGSDLVDLVQKWADAGNIDTTGVHGVQAVLDNTQWLDLSDETFVIIGATSEMGPLQFLLEHGATVIALARNNPKKAARWQRVLEMARNSAGKLIFPMNAPQNGETDLGALALKAGADVLAQTPELANWLTSVCPARKTVRVGCYIYLDGQNFVRASIAMDALFTALQSRREAATDLCLLETPSHAHVVPARCKTFARKYAREAPWWQSLMRLIGILKPMKFIQADALPLLQGQPSHIVKALVGVQGPNYAMAKIIQRWRVCAARLQGTRVSINVAPPAATNSVMHVKKVAFALKQVHHFKPNILFPPETVRVLMSLLLVRDLKDNKGLADPSTPIAHPLELVADQAWHGGNWTCAYSGDSSGVGAYLVGLTKQWGLVILLLLAALVYFLLF